MKKLYYHDVNTGDDRSFINRLKSMELPFEIYDMEDNVFPIPPEDCFADCFYEHGTIGIDFWGKHHELAFFKKSRKCKFPEDDAIAFLLAGFEERYSKDKNFFLSPQA